MSADERSRRTFLGQLGATVAAGLGLSLVPGQAHAQSNRGQGGAGRPGTEAVAYHCCKNTAVCNDNCPPARYSYRCVKVAPSCSPSSYCVDCTVNRGNCYDTAAC